MENVRTRFAPAPSGHLHIGGARTALFNYMFAEKHQGDFILRIDDTNTDFILIDQYKYTNSIIRDLTWLKLRNISLTIYQSSRLNLYSYIIEDMIQSGNAYICYCTKQELAKDIQEAIKNKSPRMYSGKCRHKNYKDNSSEKAYVVRFKTPEGGVTVIDDAVQGKITFQNSSIDDFVIFHSNDEGENTALYHLANAFDDHELKISHIIRGDDHLTNSAKQMLIIKAMRYRKPIFAHIPLVYGPDGKKLSKRTGATSISEYRKMGIIPEALKSYMMRLGWSHGDQEIFSHLDIIQHFDLKGINKAPPRFDSKKLISVNKEFLKNTSTELLASKIWVMYHNMERMTPPVPSFDSHSQRIIKGISTVVSRSGTILDMANNCLIYGYHIQPDSDGEAFLHDEGIASIRLISRRLSKLKEWTKETIKEDIMESLARKNLKMKDVGQTLRVALTGKTTSPSIFDVMEVLGKKATIGRFSAILNMYHTGKKYVNPVDKEMIAAGAYIWYNKKGQFHRNDDDPAVIYPDGSKAWYTNGVFHRNGDKPSFIYSSHPEIMKEDKIWYKNGKFHRNSKFGPAINVKSINIWCENGEIHRMDGPAVVHKLSSRYEWWYRNHRYPFDIWTSMTRISDKTYANLKRKYKFESDLNSISELFR